VQIVRAAQPRFTQLDGLAQRLLEAAALDGRLQVAEITLDPRRRQEVDPKPAGARAGVYVLEGPLIAGPVERITELGAGDYIAFPADVPHAYEAGRRATRALLLTQLPDLR
jgi:quercetin dioxygenase-like cupin family protein